jgi:hypothetical protein
MSAVYGTELEESNCGPSVSVTFGAVYARLYMLNDQPSPFVTHTSWELTHCITKAVGVKVPSLWISGSNKT